MKHVNALVLAASVAFTFGLASNSHAEDSKAVQHTKEAGRDVKKSAKKAGNDIADATCETVNGKVECAAKKAGHKMENAAGEVKDKANEPTK